MACAELKMDYTESGFMVKTEPGIQEQSHIEISGYKSPQLEDSKIQHRMPSLATLLTTSGQSVTDTESSSLSAPQNNTPIRASTLAEMLSQNCTGSIQQTNSESTSEFNSKSSELFFNERHAFGQMGAKKSLRALLTSPVSQGSQANSHTYTTRKKTGAYEKVRRPAKYMSDDLADSDMLDDATKKTYVPLNIPIPRPRQADITTVRNSTATLPKISYIGLENVQHKTGSCLPLIKPDTATMNCVSSEPKPKFTQDTQPDSIMQKSNSPYTPYNVDPDFVVAKDKLLQSLLVSHDHNTRTKSGTCKMKEDVYQAFKISAFEDEQSSYSNSACSEVEGESGNESPILKRRRKVNPRKTMVFDKDPKVYPPELPMLLDSISDMSAGAELDYESHSPGPVQNFTVVPNTCSCKFDSPTKQPDSKHANSSHVLAMLLTGSEIVENDSSRCTCGKGASSALGNSDKPATCSPEEKNKEGSPETSKVKSKESPLMASTLLCQMAKAVQKTSDRTYVSSHSTRVNDRDDSEVKKSPPEKQYTNSKEEESKESSVLRLLLTSRNEEANKSPVCRRQKRQRRLPLPSYEERSDSSSPEPSALHSLLTARESSSRRHSPYNTRKTSHTAVHHSQFVGANSVYIDNAETEEIPCDKLRYGSPLIIEPTSSEVAKDLPILNSLLSIRRRKSVPPNSIQVKSTISDPFYGGTPVKSEPLDYTDVGTRLGFGGEFTSGVKQEPVDEAYDFSMSGPRLPYCMDDSKYSSGQWHNGKNESIICIQPDNSGKKKQDSPFDSHHINPSDEYIDMEKLGKAEMPRLHISSVESLSTQSDTYTDEPKSSPSSLQETRGTVCTICGSIFKSVLLLAMHKNKVHSQNQVKTKGRKSLNSIINSCFANQSGAAQKMPSSVRLLGSLVEVLHSDSPSSDSNSTDDPTQSTKDVGHVTLSRYLPDDNEPANTKHLMEDKADNGTNNYTCSSIVSATSFTEVRPSGERENVRAGSSDSLEEISKLAGSSTDMASSPDSPGSIMSQNLPTALIANCDSVEQASDSVFGEDSIPPSRPGLTSRNIVGPSHKCAACAETFDTRAALLSHQLSHRRGKYVCESCHNAFSLHDAYVKHKLKCQSE